MLSGTGSGSGSGLVLGLVLEVVLASQVLTLLVLEPRPMLHLQSFPVTQSSIEEVTLTEVEPTANILLQFS